MRKQSDAEKLKSPSKAYGPQPLTDDDMMAKHNITCHPTSIYLYKNFRYTSLDDAMAQAKRDEKEAKS